MRHPGLAASAEALGVDTKADLARRLGVTAQAVGRWDAIGRIPPRRAYELVAATGGAVDLEQLCPELFAPEPEPTPDTAMERHSAAIAASDGLSSTEASVLRYFAVVDAGTGVTFSERQLAKHELRMDRKTLRRALKALADRGLVSVSSTSHATTVDVLVVRHPPVVGCPSIVDIADVYGGMTEPTG